MTDTTDRLAEREDALNERDRKLRALATAADRRATEPETDEPAVLVRLSDLIEDTVQTSTRYPNCVENAREVAAKILADTELCAAIADTLPVKLREDTGGQIDAIDIVLAHLGDYHDSGVSRWGNLRSDLARLRKRVEERLAEDTELGATFIALADNDDQCRTPVGVGALIRCAVKKTGRTLTGDRPLPATSEETDR